LQTPSDRFQISPASILKNGIQHASLLIAAKWDSGIGLDKMIKIGVMHTKPSKRQTGNDDLIL
jgi:hypothetical protein